MTQQDPRSVLSVPFMTAWDGEAAPRLEMRWSRGVLRLSDEEPGDRDEYGVLWARHTDAPGAGRPAFGRVHSGRQRTAMAALECQVCGNTAQRTPSGRWTWLVELAESADVVRYSRSWTTTSYPPVCTPCLELAVERCPVLRKGFAVLSVGKVTPYGVRGIRFTRTWRGVRPRGGAARHIPYDDPRIGSVLATQAVVRLDEVTLTDWAHSAHGAAEHPHVPHERTVR
ncbi:hypothetical protein [Streptomyces sp. bgisy100]|uniref:hypothetical protein n=1 Tax=Streptomyces sp. bgisy100 TaxID=3413783 RepID=UPI003D72BA06